MTITASLCPNELEFFEGMQVTKNVCACVSQKDCIGVITGVTFDSNIPQYIRDQINIAINDKIVSITNNLANGNNPSQPLFNYEVEIGYQKPLMTTEEVAEKVLKEHQEMLKNDEGIKAMAEVLATLEKQFPAITPAPIPTKVKDIINPLVVGTEITSEDISDMKTNFTDAIDKLKSINLSYFRPDYKNTNNNNDINNVNRDFISFKEIYYNKIIQKLTDFSKEMVNIKIAIVNDVINNNINAVSYTRGALSTPIINFDDTDKFVIKTNIIEINNILVGVYTAYVSEYDNGIILASINNITEIDKCL